MRCPNIFVRTHKIPTVVSAVCTRKITQELPNSSQTRPSAHKYIYVSEHKYDDIYQDVYVYIYIYLYILCLLYVYIYMAICV